MDYQELSTVFYFFLIGLKTVFKQSCPRNLNHFSNSALLQCDHLPLSFPSILPIPLQGSPGPPESLKQKWFYKKYKEMIKGEML